MTNSTHRLLLVGSHFARPAKTLLAALPQGARVRLVREPENPYDEKAIRVEVETSELEWGVLEELREELESSGFTLREVKQADSWSLGHVGANSGKPMERAKRAGIEDLWGNEDLLGACGPGELPEGKLMTSSDGIITIELKGEEG